MKTEDVKKNTFIFQILKDPWFSEINDDDNDMDDLSAKNYGDDVSNTTVSSDLSLN